MRWAVLLMLLLSVFRAAAGLWKRAVFSAGDNALRHWTATVAHIQLLIGLLLYARSPLVAWFYRHPAAAMQQREALFFALVHAGLMVSAIVVLSIGSALAKRRHSDSGKFRSMLCWYSIALALILAAIPWPGSPLASRALLRGF